MAQAAFEFSPSANLAASSRSAAVPTAAMAEASASGDGLDRCGWSIGWDHAHHRITPPLCHLHGSSPVGQGWLAGRAAFGERRLRATAAVRQWLLLRLQAWQQGAVFEEQQVNPAFLARIDADVCPISRTPLTLSAQRPEDATVLRLNPAAAYAAGNLAVVSQQVADAWAAHDWQAALAQADRLADAQRHPGTGTGTGTGTPTSTPTSTTVQGLDAAAWRRLAVLASFATPLPHAQAALLPLCVLPPNRVRVINPVQALQVMLSLQFSQAGYARRLLGLAALVPGGEARQAFQIFMHTLLARRLAVGPTPTPLQLRHAMEDTWGDVLVNRRWQRLASRLGAADCELLLQRASQRGLVVGGGRWLSADTATEGWALSAAPADTGHGRGLRAAGAPVGVPAGVPVGVPAGVPAGASAQASAGAVAARPGSMRNRGSQNVAN